MGNRRVPRIGVRGQASPLLTPRRGHGEARSAEAIQRPRNVFHTINVLMQKNHNYVVFPV